jgi:prohibitin 2
VVGGSGAEGQSAVTPFIQIPTSRNEVQSTSGGSGGGASTGNVTSSSFGPVGGGTGLQAVLNNTVLTNPAG